MSEEQKPVTMKLAIYRNIELSSPYDMVCESTFDTIAGYVRISDHVDVTFPPLSTEIQIQQHLDSLDRSEQQIRAEFGRKLDGIKQQRAQLLALPHLVSA